MFWIIYYIKFTHIYVSFFLLSFLHVYISFIQSVVSFFHSVCCIFLSFCHSYNISFFLSVSSLLFFVWSHILFFSLSLFLFRVSASSRRMSCFSISPLLSLSLFSLSQSPSFHFPILCWEQRYNKLNKSPLQHFINLECIQ